MRIGKIIKRDTQIIIVSVIVLTIITLSVSYSAFFTVQSLSTIQEIETGNLDVTVTVDNSNSIITNSEELFPSATSEAIDETTGKYSTLTIINQGDLNSDFSVTISYDFNKLREVDTYSAMSDAELLDYLVSFDYIKIGIYDSVNGTWVNFGTENAENLYPSITGLNPSSNESYTYPILRGIVKSPNNLETDEVSQSVYNIYLWLADDTPVSEIGKYVYLKINVKCAAGNETITEEVGINASGNV